jgi:gliding motility-associated-like protein
MLFFFSRITNLKYLGALVSLSLAISFIGYRCDAQSLGDPIVKITFGSGFNQYAGALPADSGFTTYNYVGRSPEDNDYTIANSTSGMNRAWFFTTDHTGDPNGYMMVVNAAVTPGLFYTRRVANLCGGTKYQFSAWIKNILIRTDGILPDVTFRIEDINGNLLLEDGTTKILSENRWREYAYVFETPANVTEVVIKMINNAPGGGGNDLAIDDITFRAYGLAVGVVFDNNKTFYCQDAPQTVTMRAADRLPPNYMARFQTRTNGDWEDMRPASTNTSIDILTATVPGKYFYRMVIADAATINSPGCFISSNFLTITVAPKPTAAIEIADEICMELTFFKEKATVSTGSIAAWLWDFGDGQTSDQIAPLHSYARPGRYTVTLTVISDAGCQSQPVSKNIRVIVPVSTDFKYSAPGCITKDVTFTDISSATEGAIISRTWDFGDGTPPQVRFDANPITHTFGAAKTYQVKLTVVTDKDCKTTKIHNVTINPLPEVDFILPEVCFADYYATFRDNSFLNGSNTGFTYLWNFGDSDAGPGNANTSTLQNPQHHFSRADKYTITLTVRTTAGCEFSTSKVLQINGSPLPKFEVKNANALCANKEVFIENQSTATVGAVTKVIIYYDTNDRSLMEVDENPSAGKPPFRHTYLPGTYNVEIVAFTGEANVCSEVATATITVAPAPTVSFSPPDAVCLNNGTVPLTYTESTGIAGTPVFTGRGVTGTVFDPLAAGIGTWPVTLVYTTALTSGCADTIIQNITVKPIPTMVDAGPNVAILSGTTTALRASASGNNLKYRWSPVTGLSDATIPNPVVSLLDNTTTYTLTVTLDDSTAPGPLCGVTDVVTVTVLKTPQIPNAFTPNGDGINDRWEIKNLEQYEGATINVFNRYGQRVYSSIGYSLPWEGRINGGDLPSGVYYYIINPKHGRVQVSGYVTIIR